MIETDSIASTSPSVISRTNLITIDSNLFNESDVFRQFLTKKLPSYFKRYQDILKLLFVHIFLNSLDKLYENPKSMIYQSSRRSLVLSFIKMLDIFINELLKSFLCSGKISSEKVFERMREDSLATEEELDSQELASQLFGNYDKKFRLEKTHGS